MMTISYKKYDVVVIPFPFIDSDLSKLRPALVLSSEEFNQETKMVTCIMITSSTHEEWASDVDILNLQKAGLKKKCKARFKVFSIQGHLIRRNIGRLDKKDQERVRVEFHKILG